MPLRVFASLCRWRANGQCVGSHTQRDRLFVDFQRRASGGANHLDGRAQHEHDVHHRDTITVLSASVETWVLQTFTKGFTKKFPKNRNMKFVFEKIVVYCLH